MKLSLILVSAALLSVSGLAHAKPIIETAPVQTCSSEMADAGFRVDDRAFIANVFESNIAGENFMATLKCKAPKPSTGPVIPDMIHTGSTCRGKGKDGKSYSVTFKSGGFAGLSFAELSIDKGQAQRLPCHPNAQ